MYIMHRCKRDWETNRCPSVGLSDETVVHSQNETSWSPKRFGGGLYASMGY